MEVCPICRASLRGASICRRCRADLAGLSPIGPLGSCRAHAGKCKRHHSQRNPRSFRQTLELPVDNAAPWPVHTVGQALFTRAFPRMSARAKAATRSNAILSRNHRPNPEIKALYPKVDRLPQSGGRCRSSRDGEPVAAVRALRVAAPTAPR
jgi:hypothetical protein